MSIPIDLCRTFGHLQLSSGGGLRFSFRSVWQRNGKPDWFFSSSRAFVLSAFAFWVFLSGAWAQQAVSTGQALQDTELAVVQNEDDEAKLSQDWRALCDQMRTQKLSPAQRIGEVENWQNTNRARLGIQKLKLKASQASRQTSDNSLQVEQSSGKGDKQLTGDELALFELQNGIRQAVNEMNAWNLTPGEHIGQLDEFFKLNTDSFKEAERLQKKVQIARPSHLTRNPNFTGTTSSERITPSRVSRTLAKAADL